MCVVHACHPMRSIERTIRIPSRRHREVEAGSTGNARMEFEIGCVSIAQYSYFLKKQSFYVKFIQVLFIHASSRRVFQSRNVRNMTNMATNAGVHTRLSSIYCTACQSMQASSLPASRQETHFPCATW